MARSQSIEIDGNRLREEFKIRNLAFSDASSRCGYEASYFSKVCKLGKITQPAINLLKANFNIDYDSYAVEETIVLETKKESAEFTITDEVSDKLYQIIYSATYHAMKQALSE